MVEKIPPPSFLEVFLLSWAEIDLYLQGGPLTVERSTGMGYFQFLAHDTQLSMVFNGAMGIETACIADRLVKAWQWPPESLIVDVGGGNGALCAAILSSEPSLTGIVYDTPAGLAGAEDILSNKGVGDRCIVTTGDFMVAVPTGAAVYVMKSVLHDWNDTDCIRILAACRAAMRPGSHLIIFETLLPSRVIEPATDRDLFLSDMQMLVLSGGRERTKEELAELLSKVGLTIERCTMVEESGGYHLVEIRCP